jgi:hypothetical protein
MRVYWHPRKSDIDRQVADAIGVALARETAGRLVIGVRMRWLRLRLPWHRGRGLQKLQKPCSLGLMMFVGMVWWMSVCYRLRMICCGSHV